MTTAYVMYKGVYVKAKVLGIAEKSQTGHKLYLVQADGEQIVVSQESVFIPAKK